MWVPTDEADLLGRLAEGTIVETASFDVKRELPPLGRNKDLAKDICAMTVAGGVLLYGIGGDDSTRPDTPFPFELAGVSERIDQVAQTGISEPPTIEICDIPSEQQPGRGYLAVVIPPSSRAPHMLTIEGDNRYWARGATGNRVLDQDEVARLYQRRDDWELDGEAWIKSLGGQLPFEFEDPVELIGPMLVAIRPVAPPSDLISRAAGDEEPRAFLQRSLQQWAGEADPYPSQGTSGIETVYYIVPLGAERWLLRRDRNATFPYQAHLTLDRRGELTYWHAPVINSGVRRTSEGGQIPILMEQSVTRAAHQAFACAARLYVEAGFQGALDCGVVVRAVGDAVAASAVHAFQAETLGVPDYVHYERITALELADVEDLTRRFVQPLYDAISVRAYDPYGESPRRDS